MKRWFPLGLLGMASSLCLLFPIMSPAQAPAAPPAPPPAITIEDALGQLREGDEALAKKVEAARAVIEAEVAAKRITAPVAQSLQWSLRSATLTNASDFNTVIGSSRLPADNAAILESLRGLEADWSATQAQRLKLIKAAVQDARTRVEQSVRAVEKPADLDPLIALIDRLQEAAQGRTIAVSNVMSSASFSALQPFLRSLRRFIEVSSPPADPVLVSAAINQMQGNTRGVINESDVQKRVERAVAHFQQAQDAALETLDRLVREKKPAADYAAALARLEEAAMRNQTASSNNMRGSRDSNAIIGFYRNVGQVVAAMEAGDSAAAKNAMSNLRGGSLQALGAIKAQAYTQQLAAWSRAIDEASEQAATRQREAWRARLAGVKKPADLEAFVTELAREGAQVRERGGNDTAQGLAAQLNMLLAAWTGGNPALLDAQNFQNDSRLGPEVVELRRRIERDVIVRVLRAPELDQPPLASVPLDTALEQLSAQLAEKREWRRLLQLTEARTGAGRHGGQFSRESDLATAVRAFLAGQNLELAEQWTDAMQSYKTALLCTDDQAPTRDAAARVIALTKEHPDLFAPQPSAPPGNPRPRVIIPAPQPQ